jgi:hypothetical protein
MVCQPRGNKKGIKEKKSKIDTGNETDRKLQRGKRGKKGNDSKRKENSVKERKLETTKAKKGRCGKTIK